LAAEIMFYSAQALVVQAAIP